MSALPVRLQHKSGLVVCDGAKALFLQNDGNADRPQLRLIEAVHRRAEASRELGTDRPGRVQQSFGSAGSARSAVEMTDLHLAGELAFIDDFTTSIVKAAASIGCTRLVLAAPPKILGELRRRWPQSAAALVVGEVGKDLTKLPLSEIERHFS